MKTSIIYVAIVIVVLGGLFFLVKAPAKAGPLDAFATCIKDSGAKFYGAFWCPHCQNQKALFGSSAHLLPYIECSTPDGQSQNALCNTADIKTYPTWEFKDGHRLVGETSLADLAKATSCTLPK